MALLALQLLFCQTCAANIHGTRLFRLSLPNCCCVSLTLQIAVAYDPDDAMEAPAGVFGADPCHDVGPYRVSSAYAASTCLIACNTCGLVDLMACSATRFLKLMRIDHVMNNWCGSSESPNQFRQ